MTISNMPEYLKEAADAGKALTNMSKNEGRAEALAIHAMYEAWNVYEFSYTVKRRGDEEDGYTCTLDEMDIDPVNADGSTDGKRKAARFAALMSQLFGVTDATNAQQSVIRRALLSARFLVRKGHSCEVKNGNIVTEKAAVVELPAGASDNDKAEYEETKDKKRVLDGKNGMSLAELRKRAEKACPPRNRKVRKPSTANDDKGKTLTASIGFVSAVVQSWIDPDGESDVAPSNDMRKMLFDLQVQLAQMFTDDPLEQDERNVA